MKELGMALLGSFAIFGFFGFKIYPDLEYTGYSSVGNCTGECYQEYVKVNGTVVEQLQRQQLRMQKTHLVRLEVFGVVVQNCHGNEGQGMGMFPKLAGQSADYISGRLYQYQNGETVGNMSSTMWGFKQEC